MNFLLIKGKGAEFSFDYLGQCAKTWPSGRFILFWSLHNSIVIRLYAIIIVYSQQNQKEALNYFDKINGIVPR